MILHGSKTFRQEVGIAKHNTISSNDGHANIERFRKVLGEANRIVTIGMQTDVCLGKRRRLVQLIFDLKFDSLFNGRAQKVSKQESDDTKRASVQKNQAGMESKGHSA